MAPMNAIRNIVILTGAGISAESGIDTFRSEGGLWEQHRVEDVATLGGQAVGLHSSRSFGLNPV